MTGKLYMERLYRYCRVEVSVSHLSKQTDPEP